MTTTLIVLLVLGVTAWRISTWNQAEVDRKIRATAALHAARPAPRPEGWRPWPVVVAEVLGQALIAMVLLVFAAFLIFGDTVATDRWINARKADASAWWGGR